MGNNIKSQQCYHLQLRYRIGGEEYGSEEYFNDRQWVFNDRKRVNVIGGRLYGLEKGFSDRKKVYAVVRGFCMIGRGPIAWKEGFYEGIREI